ncbi:hypothetical protein K1719_047470 [Acacia pycnantha]|nr:hypothetical protein K1719_047470 [Acacia pycnantha]
MDSNTFLNYQHQRQPNPGLLRFRSAPTSVLANFTQSLVSDLSKGNNPWENSESEKLISRFVNNDDLDSSGFQEFEAKPPKAQTEAALNHMNSYNNGLPLTTQGKIPRQVLQWRVPMDWWNRWEWILKRSPRASLRIFSGKAAPLPDFSPTLPFQMGIPPLTVLETMVGRMAVMISEIEGESIEATNPDNGGLESVNGYVPGFPYSSWNDASHLSENLGGLKREPSNSENLFSNAQNGPLGNRVHMLSHHLSLPKPSADIMEKFLQFPDSVPCKIRAKRGCATHPRSIAERVRRTRISERMRKIQELVPNMDKQTNTADMLDLAVEYIKDLQKQFKTLSEKKANCKCMSTQKADANQVV